MIKQSQRSQEEGLGALPKFLETVPPLASSPPFLLFQPISLKIQNESPGVSPNPAFKISGNKAFTTSLRETIFQPTVLHSKAFHPDSQLKHALP